MTSERDKKSCYDQGQGQRGRWRWAAPEKGGRREEGGGGRAVRYNENIQDQDQPQLWQQSGSLVLLQLELLIGNIDFACFVKQRPVSLNQSETNCSLLPSCSAISTVYTDHKVGSHVRGCHLVNAMHCNQLLFLQ